MYIACIYFPVKIIFDYHPLHGYRFTLFCVRNTPKPKKHLDIKFILCDKRIEAEESFDHQE